MWVSVEPAELLDRLYSGDRWMGAQDQRALLSSWSFSPCGIPRSFARVVAPSGGRKPGISLDPLPLIKAPNFCQRPLPRTRGGGRGRHLWVYGPLCELSTGPPVFSPNLHLCLLRCLVPSVYRS